MTIHVHSGEVSGRVFLPVGFSKYQRAEDHAGERYVAVQATGGLGCQVYQYIPETRRFELILSPGQEQAWELRTFRLLPDGRLLLECSPQTGRHVNQWIVWSPEMEAAQHAEQSRSTPDE